MPEVSVSVVSNSAIAKTVAHSQERNDQPHGASERGEGTQDT